MRKHQCNSKEEDLWTQESGSFEHATLKDNVDDLDQQLNIISHFSSIEWKQQVKEGSSNNVIPFDMSNTIRNFDTISVMSDGMCVNSEVCATWRSNPPTGRFLLSFLLTW